MNRALTEAALRLAASGLHVFPCSRDKVPCVEGGFKSASRDADAIKEMFARRGVELIGVATGASRLVVIDVDAKDGHDGRLWVFENADRLPATRVHRTRSGGKHWVFAAPDGRTVPSGNSRLARGVDVKARGGYVVWPSGLGDGYTVARDLPPAVLPQWMVEACHPLPAALTEPIRVAPAPASSDVAERIARVALRKELDRIGAAGPGARNETLNRAAFNIGQLVAGGCLGENEARDALIDAGKNMPNSDPTRRRSEREVVNTVRSGFEAGKKHPRVPQPRPVPATSTGGRAHAQ